MDRDVIFMVAFVLGSSGFSLLLFLWFLCIFFLDEKKKGKCMIYRIVLFKKRKEGMKRKVAPFVHVGFPISM
jgi:hypothetical protein